MAVLSRKKHSVLGVYGVLGVDAEKRFSRRRKGAKGAEEGGEGRGSHGGTVTGLEGFWGHGRTLVDLVFAETYYLSEILFLLRFSDE